MPTLHLHLRMQVLLEAKFASVVTAIAVMEGLGRSLDPDLDILREAAPIILQAKMTSAVNQVR